LAGKTIGYIENGEFIPKEGNRIPFPEDIDFALFHQGLLDKIYSHNTDEEVRAGFKKIRSYINAEYNIIHSGRSKPPNLPPDMAFLQYASLENSLADCNLP